MGPLVVLLIVVVVVLVAGYYLFWKPRRKPARTPGASGPDVGPGPDLNLETLRPGDIVALWSGKESVAERVVSCQETLPGRVTRWKWVFLEGGQLLALAPVGHVLYADTAVLYQGSEPYARLTGAVEQGGVLKTFEARVRDGTVGVNPVVFEHSGEQYRVQSTGTFGVADQPVPDTEVWRDVQADEGQNVYFKLSGPDGAQALGVWTSHIALLVGRPLAEADVREIYRAGR